MSLFPPPPIFFSFPMKNLKKLSGRVKMELLFPITSQVLAAFGDGSLLVCRVRHI